MGNRIVLRESVGTTVSVYGYLAKLGWERMQRKAM